MKKSFALIVTMMLIAAAQVGAQTYNTALGVRINKGVNFSFKNSVGERDYLEAILHTPVLNPNIGVTLLYERHKKVLTRNTSLYYGAGAHAYAFRKRIDDTLDKDVLIGATGIGGLDLCLGRLNLSADIMPELHLFGGASKAFELNGVSITARYIIDKKERKRLRDRIHRPEWGQRERNGSGRDSRNRRRS